MTSPDPKPAALVFDLALRQVTRLVLDHSNQLRGVLWLAVRPDLTVVLGLHRAAAIALRDQKPAKGGEPVTFQFKNAEIVSDTRVLRSLHITFHPSGAVNAAGQRSWLPEWRKLASPRQLCSICLEEPSRYPIIPAIRKRDTIIHYQPDPNQQLVARLLVSPPGAPVILEDPSAGDLTLAYDLRQPDGSVGLRVQLTIRERALGSWPDRTIICWSAENHERPSEQRGAV